MPKEEQVPGSVTVRLTNKSLTRDAAVIIAASLSSCLAHHSVSTVDISDIIAGRPEEEALFVLASISAGWLVIVIVPHVIVAILRRTKI